MKEQPLPAFLEAEGLLETIEMGLVGAAGEFGREAGEFRREAFAALDGWTVRPSNAVSRFGSVTPRTRTLRLTSHDCSPEARQDTILHEVAHILTEALVARRALHGPHWRTMARALGAQPRRVGHDDRFKQAAAAHREARLKVVARCDRCGFEVRRMRRSTRNWRRFSHIRCGGRFSPIEG